MVENQINCRFPLENGKCLLLDDIYSNDKWDVNQSFTLDSNISIMIQKYQTYFFIGIKYKHLESYITDVYLYPGGVKIYQLQESHKLSEYKSNILKTSLSELDWVIGNPDQWISDTLKKNKSENSHDQG